MTSIQIRLRLLPCIVVAALGGSSLADTIVFADGDFDLADWTETSWRFGSGGTATISQVPGNPGTARQVRQVVFEPGPANVVEFHALNSAVYNPVVDGEILSVDFSLEYLNVATESPPFVSMTFVLAIKQGDSYFTPPGFGTGSATGWQSVNAIYTEADFGLMTFDALTLMRDEDIQPDFSSSGGEIEIGFITANSDGTAVGVDDDRTAAFDNFSVTLTTHICPEDLDGDGVVGSSDLAALLAAWGTCK